MCIPATHNLSLTRIRRERTLPLPGTVLVEAGQPVMATDVIAETGLTNPHILVDVCQVLGVTARQVSALLRVKTQDIVQRGEILAGPVGFPPRQARAPQSGKVIYVHNGQVVLEAQRPPYQLLAGLDGQVTRVLPGRGAVIESTGALIQGIWGNGRLARGLLTIPGDGPAAELSGDYADNSLQGVILAAGTVRQVEVFRAFKKAGAAGLILGSLPGSLVPLAAQADIPIVILDGFGKLPINPLAYRILSENAGREVVVNAISWDRQNDLRPEVVISLPSENPVLPVEKALILRPDQDLRVTSAVSQGQVGKLIAL
jgi:hypothetical protein